MPTGTDVLLNFTATDNVSSVTNTIKGNVEGLSGAAGSAASSGESKLQRLASSCGGLNGALMGVMGTIGTQSFGDLIFGTSKTAETNKVLVSAMTDTKAQADDLYNTIDKTTDTSLVSMQQLIPSLSAFQAASGATGDTLQSSVVPGMADFGQYVYAMTGSTALAQTAMTDLSKGLNGSFASLDQYKLSEEALMNTHLWSGKADDVEGYMAAVEKVIGNTDDLMNTTTGMEALMNKSFSRAGKNLGKDLLPVEKELLKTFGAINDATGGKFAEGIVAAGYGASVLSTTLGGIGAAANGILALKDTFGVLKDAISGAKTTLEGFKKVEDAAGAADEIEDIAGGTGKSKGNTKIPENSSGGIVKAEGEVDEISKVGFKEGVANNMKSMGTSFITAAVGIAMGMALITEALILLQGPLWALAEVGKFYKAKEKSIKAGIDGLKTTAIILVPVGVAVAAIMAVIGATGGAGIAATIVGGIGGAIGIAIGIGLMTEFLIGLEAPLMALSEVGKFYKANESNIKSGIQGVKTVGSIFTALGPSALIFVAAVMVFSNVGIAALAGIGIAATITLLVETIEGLKAPLISIADIGKSFGGKIGQVKQGANVIRQIGIALQAVAMAAGSITSISMDSLKTWLSGGGDLKTTLDKMTASDGVLVGLKNFATKFNKVIAGMQPINMQGVTALATASTAILQISNVVKTLQNAMNTMKSSGMTTGTASSGGASTGNYLKKSLNEIKIVAQDLAKFNQQFSAIQIQPIDTAKVAALNQTGNSLKTLQRTINTVKQAVKSIGSAGGVANTTAYGSIGGAVAGAVSGTSLRGGLQQLLKAVDDVIWFNKQLNAKTAGAGGNGASGLSKQGNAISGIANTIKQISSALTNAIPTVKGKGNAIGQAITTGIKTGMNNLNSTITSQFVSAMSSLISTGRSKGSEMGNSVKSGYSSTITGLTSVTQTEISHALSALDAAKSQFYSKGAALGQAASDGYQSTGLEQKSPGRIARSTAKEVNYALTALNTSQSSLYSAGARLGKAVVDGFGKPSLNIGSSILNTKNNKLDYTTHSLQTLQTEGLDKAYKPSTPVKHVNIQVGEGAVQLDARNLTTKESQQVMIQAMEGFKSIKDVTV